MQPFFNLSDEPWIPCLVSDGRLSHLSLREVLRRAPEIREIYHFSPLVVVALHRLLLAILHRNFGPASQQDWQHLWRRRCWDERVLDRYFTSWHERFFLFHPHRPFYQVPPMPEAKEHPIQLLAQEAAAGNNPTLFDHHFAARPAAFTPDQAACYLLARQLYSIGFGKSKPFYFSDSPLIRGYTLLLLGHNLFETLALNLLVYNQHFPFEQQGQDLPIWELDPLPKPNPRGNLPTGYLMYLTWQSRRIHLLPPDGDPPRVRYCQIQQGWKMPEPEPLDPFKAYRRDKKQGLLPRGLDPEKASWRDSHALMQLQERPEILASLAERARLPVNPPLRPLYHFTLTGVTTEVGNPANVILWRQERLPLPLAYLEDQELLGQLKLALEYAEQAYDIVTRTLKRLALQILYPAASSISTQSRQEASRLVQSWAPGRRFWPSLATPFRELLVQLPDDRVEDENGDLIYGDRCLPSWQQTVARQAQEVFAELIRGLEPSRRGLKAVAQIEGYFYGNLQQFLSSGGAI